MLLKNTVLVLNKNTKGCKGSARMATEKGSDGIKMEKL